MEASLANLHTLNKVNETSRESQEQTFLDPPGQKSRAELAGALLLAGD